MAAPSATPFAEHLAPPDPRPSGQSPTAGVTRSAASAASATMASRLLGLVRDQVLASIFGAGNAMDAFNVAFRIPNLVRDLFAEGAMSAAFVPTFTRHLTRSGKTSAWILGNHVINALVLITGVLVVLGIVFAEPIVNVFASSYAAVPGKLELTVSLTRIMLPFLILVAVAAAVMGMLNSLQRFFLPALSPAMFNVATIASALLLVPMMPRVGLPAITAVAIGAVLGGILQLTLQWPALRREGFRYRPVLDWHDEGLRRVLLLMGPGTIGLAATQVSLFVNTVLATGEGTGAVSWLNYAFRIMYLPIGLFGVSIATATLPVIARHAAHAGGEDRKAIRETVASGLSLMTALNLPATVGLIVLAGPIVQVIFERGAFLPEDTVATAAALQLYAIGLVGYSVVRIGSPTFYALGQPMTPIKVSMVTMVISIVLNVILVRTIGYRGLALGTSIAAIVNAATLMYLLHRRLDGVEGRRLAWSLARVLLASLAMAAAAVATYGALETAVPGAGLAAQMARLTTTIGVALAVLAAAAHLLGVRELRNALSLATRRLRR
jgi:putative peptidoglycan lipid II flippase